MKRLLACLLAAFLVAAVAAADHRRGHDSRPGKDPYAKAPAAAKKKLDDRTLAERRRLKRKLAERRTPRAKRQRRASRDAFASLSRKQAIRVARARFPSIVGADPYRGVRLRDGDRVKKHLDDRSALVRRAGDSRDLLVESTLPLVARRDDGRKASVDLRLETKGEDVAPVNPIVDLELSRDARRGVALPSSGVRVHPARVDPGAAAGSIVEDKLFYGNTGPDTDFLVMPMPTGFETFNQLRSAASPEDQSLAFDLPPGAKLGWTRPEGAPAGFGYYEIKRGDDRLATITQPRAFDADGFPVPVEASVVGNELRTIVKHRGGDFRYPIMLDPSVTDDFIWIGNPITDTNGWTEGWNSWPWGWSRTTGYLGQYGLHVWSSGDGTAWYNVNDYAEWYWDAPGTSIIELAEFGFLRHNNAPGAAPMWFWDCVETGVWGKNAGGSHPGGAGWDAGPIAECGPTYDYPTSPLGARAPPATACR